MSSQHLHYLRGKYLYLTRSQFTCYFTYKFLLFIILYTHFLMSLKNNGYPWLSGGKVGWYFKALGLFSLTSVLVVFLAFFCDFLLNNRSLLLRLSPNIPYLEYSSLMFFTSFVQKRHP